MVRFVLLLLKLILEFEIDVSYFIPFYINFNNLKYNLNIKKQMSENLVRISYFEIINYF